MLSDELFEECLRALYFAPAEKPTLALLMDMHGSVEGFRAALELAFTAGRESAYTSDEWRVAYYAPIGWLRSPGRTRAEADSCLAYCREKAVTDAYLEHRRTGSTDWEKVADELQA